MSPERRAPADEAGAIPNDTTTTNDTDSRAIGEAVEKAALSVLLSAPTAQLAASIVHGIKEDAFLIPEHQAVYRGILVAIESGQPPHPVTVAVAIQRAGITIPPTWRGTLHSRLWAIAADAPPVPMARWLLEQVQEQANRRAVEHAGTAIAEIAHAGEYADMTAAVQRHLDALRDLLAPEAVVA